MIEGWNSKHLSKRLCMQAAREAHFAVSLTAGTELWTIQKVLSLQTALNSNAVIAGCVHVPAAACVEAV